MKIVFIYLLIILFTLNCSNFKLSRIYKKFARKTEFKYYGNGCKKQSISFFNNQFDGPMIKWNENCNMISETNYENGKLHGYWSEYYESGQLMHSVKYFFGQKNGHERWYYENGKLKTEVSYEFDMQVSDMLTWNKFGKLLN